MSIKPRGTSWQVHVKVAGVSVRRSFKTRAEAREQEPIIRADLKTAPVRGLDDALATYLTGEATLLRDQKGIKTNARALVPFINGRTIHEAPQVASEAKQSWLAAGLLPATINRRLALLRRLLNMCFEWGWTDLPLGKRIKLLPGEVERQIYLSHDQVEALASAMTVGGDMVRLTAYTGLRLGECMGLTQDNVQGHTLVLARTKNTKPRTIPVPKRVRHILKSLPWAVTEHVRRDAWGAARKACGLEFVRWHDLRHTYASFLAAKGYSDREMGELLGHLSSAMVRRYAHLRKQHLVKLVVNL